MVLRLVQLPQVLNFLQCGLALHALYVTSSYLLWHTYGRRHLKTLALCAKQLRHAPGDTYKAGRGKEKKETGREGKREREKENDGVVSIKTLP